jgi:hypothetical protein
MKITKIKLSELIKKELDKMNSYKIISQGGKILAIDLTYRDAMKIIDSSDGEILPMEDGDKVEEEIN